LSAVDIVVLQPRFGVEPRVGAEENVEPTAEVPVFLAGVGGAFREPPELVELVIVRPVGPGDRAVEAVARALEVERKALVDVAAEFPLVLFEPVSAGVIVEQVGQSPRGGGGRRFFGFGLFGGGRGAGRLGSAGLTLDRNFSARRRLWSCLVLSE